MTPICLILISQDNMTGTSDVMLEFEAATEEWDNVATIEPSFQEAGAGGGGEGTSSHPLEVPLTGVEEVLEYLEGEWMDEYTVQVLFCGIDYHVWLMFGVHIT